DPPAKAPPTPQPDALPLPDALPIYDPAPPGHRLFADSAEREDGCRPERDDRGPEASPHRPDVRHGERLARQLGRRGRPAPRGLRSEEHTSELQSRFDLVCRLLPEKK